MGELNYALSTLLSMKLRTESTLRSPSYKGELQEKLNSMGVETDIIHYLPWRHHRSEPKLKSSAIFLIKIVINLIQEVHIYHFLRKHKVDLVHINTTAVYAGPFLLTFSIFHLYGTCANSTANQPLMTSIARVFLIGCFLTQASA